MKAPKLFIKVDPINDFSNDELYIILKRGNLEIEFEFFVIIDEIVF